jgi:hypothetical protein
MVRISTPNVCAELVVEMDVEARVFDDNEKQRVWLGKCRRQEAFRSPL